MNFAPHTRSTIAVAATYNLNYRPYSLISDYHDSHSYTELATRYYNDSSELKSRGSQSSHDKLCLAKAIYAGVATAVSEFLASAN